MPNAPQVQSVVDDFIALANTFALLLASDDRLQYVPVIPEYKLLMDSELATDILWTLPRACIQLTGTGWNVNTTVPDDPSQMPPVGCGLLVEMPTFVATATAVTGPPATTEINVVAFEERNINWTSGTGIFISVEQLASIALDVMHLWGHGLYGTFKAKPGMNPSPARDWMEQKPGIMAYRATVHGMIGRQQTQRETVVTFNFSGGMCTLGCIDVAATIYYTLDGSCPVKANPQAVKYSGPFPSPASGSLVFASAWAPGLVNGPANKGIAP